MRPAQIQNKAALLNKPLVKENKPRRVTPSAFTQEMLQSTEERLSNTVEVQPPRILELLPMNGPPHQRLTTVDMSRPLFQPYPSELVFQNFFPSQTYKLPLLLVNKDKVSRHVKLEHLDSEQFYVEGPQEAGSKVAPGMSATFTVLFKPQENKDYSHRVVCVTERERFEIPIRAIGPRAILDFRDEVLLPACPVKGSTQKTHLVRNVGNTQAKFRLQTQRPFSVTPASGTLDVGHSMQVTVDFHPTTVGDHQQDLLLHYDTGEDVYISLSGSCEELNIQLKPDSLTLRNTYISLATARTVSLTNGSDIPLQYCWRMCPCLQEEDLSSSGESSAIRQSSEEEEGRGPSQCQSDHTATHHLPPQQGDRSQAAGDPPMALSLSCITVEPAEGEIWPNARAQFTIIFKPAENKHYHQIMYCDITGREKPLPLTIKGEGLGPELQLDFNLMEMKNVFMGYKDCYEVQLSNTGLIDAPFRFSRPNTTFGRYFSFRPGEGVVPPGACQIVEVTFQSRILGTFSEDLLLTVTGHPQPLTLTFRGCVIAPTFHFDIYELNFGDVAFGFPVTSTFTLRNTSFVPMTFALRVRGDGFGSASVTSADQVSDLSRKNWQGQAPRHARPVEFTVSPATGSVRAMSEVTIKVTLCSNTVWRYRAALVVDVEGVGEEIMSLPISARCVVPEVTVEPPVLDFQRCFLRYPYEQKVFLSNPSTLPACYGLLDQENQESSSVLFGSSVPRGVLLPGSSVELPVLLVAKAVGRLHHTLRIAVFGSPQQPLEVMLSCIGQGPVVHIQRTELQFGTVPVLRDITRTLHLSNQSPIPAPFTARTSQRRSFWRVEPSDGEVPPGSQLELTVVAHLKDTLPVQDRLEVSILDSQTHSVSLSATGTGTTIVSDRPFGPSLDLGTHFSHGLCQYRFKLTNHGQRVHRMFWKINGSLFSTKKSKEGSFPNRTFLPPITTPRQKDMPSRGSSLPSSRDKLVFNLSPSRVELFPGSSVDMVLTVSADSPKTVRQQLVCHGIIGQKGCQETIMSVDVTCRFVAPMLSISTKKLNFDIKKIKGQSMQPQNEKLVLRNLSSLPLSMELSLVEPFSVCEAPGDLSSATAKSLVLGDRSQAELWVRFDPTFYRDRLSRILDEVLEIHYVGHPQQDNVELHAEVHFPNLHFSSTNVDFGCVFNCTETHEVITITNCSPLPVSYHWTFVDNQKQSDVSPGPNADAQSCTPRPLCVEEVFDILPIYGHLQPGDQQLLTFSFFGHENVSREVMAQCHVEEGPTYDIKLKGEASEISYSLKSAHLDFGVQLFYCVGDVEVILRNTGKMGFKFSITHPQREEEEAEEEAEEHIQVVEVDHQPPAAQQQEAAEKHEDGQQVRPGWPVVIPAVGYIDAGSQQCLRVLYLPGIPEVFQKVLQLQVAFLPPQEITLTGVGVFPRIGLNLPRTLSEESYGDVLHQAKAAVEAERLREELTNDGGATAAANCTLTYEELLHMEVERLLVKENALSVFGSLLEQRDLHGSPTQWSKLSKFELPEYILDFGSVIPGRVDSVTVKVINNGSIPVSFHANCKRLTGTGFTAEFERVKNLPCGETQTFTVKLDPRGAELKRGDTSVLLPIQVAGGPAVQVRLRAVFTVPAITVSEESLQFDTVQCGMCQIKTMQLQNNELVSCHWSIAEEVKPVKKAEKLLHLYKHKKVLQGEQRVVFEVVPCSGLLSPLERVRVQIKFSPAKGGVYNRRLEVRVADSPQQAFITAQGHGEEPQLEFCPSVLELGPCLPLSTEGEAEVTVRNPCPFPIEFYSLEFDTQYQKEEKILRLMPGYDEKNTLLLPQRVPGEGLPPELLEYFENYSSQLRHNEGNVTKEGDEARKDYTQEDIQAEISTRTVKPADIFVSELTKVGSSGRLGELEMTPVSRAIARHMGFDLSPEGLAARNRRGIAVIVYGAPLTETRCTAAALASHYGAACLNVDAVVTEVLRNGTSAVSLSARQLYEAAAAECAQRKTAEAAGAAPCATEEGPAAPTEASEPKSGLVSVNTEAVVKHNETSCSENDSTAPLGTENIINSLGLEVDVAALVSLLPEQLLVDVLAERFQRRDCFRGVVIDGLESVFSQCASSTLQIVLKALSNRKHIYVVNLSDSYDALKARERVQREAEEALQKERADREERWLQEMDEDQYEALPLEEKERITQRHLKSLRQLKLRRDLEQVAKEKEQKKQEEEIKRLEEEELKKKNRGGGKKENKEPPKKKNPMEGKPLTANVQRTSSFGNAKESLDAKEHRNLNERSTPLQHGNEADDSLKEAEETKRENSASPQATDKLEKEKTPVCSNSKDSVTDAKELRNPTEAVSKSSAVHQKETDRSPKRTEEARRQQTDSHQQVNKPEGDMCIVDNLLCQFTEYEQNQAHVEHILQYWDRAQGLLLVPLNSEETLQSEDTPTEKQLPVVKKSKKGKTISPQPSNSRASAEPDHKAEEKMPSSDIIPHIVLDVTEKDCGGVTELLSNGPLPPVDDLLEDLGLAPDGPQIPPSTTFSVVPFPTLREPVKTPESCFTLLIPSGVDDDEDKKGSEEETTESLGKEDGFTTASKSQSRGSNKESSSQKEKDKKAKESLKSKKRASSKTKVKRLNGPNALSQASSTDQDQQQGSLELKLSQSLNTFRWLVPANGEVVLRVWFYSESLGTFEQALNFELVGTRRLYQLPCRGICTYPSICKDYTNVFANSKWVQHMKNGLQKAFVISAGHFEFGPLLCSKSRDRYKESRYPENAEKLVIRNNSDLEAEVQFSFQHDTQASTYLLDPPTLTLKPGQKKELTVWAYPTKQGQIKDCIVCHIRDNPEPVIIKLSCWGVRPELELDTKLLHFGRILLHRRDSRSVMMRNKTALPVFWRLQGVEELGEEFVVPIDEDTIPPHSSFLFSIHFRPRRSLHMKKMLRLEVSDAERIVGIVQTENIQVIAEAYDIDLEITPDSILDFGILSVYSEAKLPVKLKNKGKYEIAFKFSIEQTNQTPPNLGSIFTVSPHTGSLIPHERHTTVLITCKPDREICLIEEPILPCQVIEPNIGKEGETIATLNIKVSAEAVFSRFTITPAYDLNFGPMAFGCKKSLNLTIENSGVFEMHFSISHMITELGGPVKMVPDESNSAKPTCPNAKPRRESFQRKSTLHQNRLTIGVFSLFPCTGSLLPGCQQLVAVDCVAEQLGSWCQGLLFDITGRNPSEHPDGIPYRLLADICKPGIVLDMASIFEEHHLCQNSSQLSSEQFCTAESVYVLDENKFIFRNTLVGRTAKARFKITNNSKVHCVLNMAIKGVGPKTSRNVEVFDLSTITLNIPNQSHAFAVVTFTPQSVQQYFAVFEATLEGLNRAMPTSKSKVLEFDLMGEGTLPSVCVERPSLRSSKGSPMLAFRRVLVGRRHTLPLVLLNDGNVPAQVQIDMLDKNRVFTLKAAPGNTSSSIQSTQLEGPTDSECQSVHRAVLWLNVNKLEAFEVSFCSDRPLTVKAKISVQVKDNQYSNTIIMVTAEAYQEIVSLDYISRPIQDLAQEEEGEGNCEVLHFGDCHVDCQHQESFTMINHSSNQVVRFEWLPSGSHVNFSPQVGHLHAGCSKEVNVIFWSSQPVTLKSKSMKCKFCRVEFQQPLEQVADWDDRQRTVQWHSASKVSEAPQLPVASRVVQTDPEPSCSVVDGSQWELDLLISAVCDYAKFSCSNKTIHFKDTMLFQTRVHQLQIVNKGSVKVDYSWQVLMDSSSSSGSRDGDGSPTTCPGSADSLTAARPSSALLRVATLLTVNPELPAFTVEPSAGTISPGATQDFSVRFSPVELAQFQGRLICSIPNLQDGNRAPCIPVFGRSLLPHCHFDFEDSDYISGHRRRVRRPVDLNSRVLEFEAVGFSTPSKRCFSVLNPTSRTYSFKWRCEDDSASPFRCLSPCGSILPGKRVQVCFEYVADQLDTVESFWTFVIETVPLSVPFLLVGTTREPLVYFQRPHLDLGELLVGRKAEQTVALVNGELEPLSFSVLPESLLSEDQLSGLIVHPMSGTVAPKDRLPLFVSLTPSLEAYVSFRVTLKVRRRSEPLTLTVRADCFAMSATVQVEQPDGALKDVSPNYQDTLDFGKVGISEQSTFKLLVSNCARFSLEVNFELMGPGDLLQHLEAKPQTATIEVGKQLQSLLFFSPQSICNLQDVSFNVKVKFGPTFTFTVKGGAVAPSLEFSFSKFNFGRCFLFCPGMQPLSKTLVISNKGRRDVSVQCLFKNTHFLKMDFQPDILSPGAAIRVPLTFYPSEARRYHEKLSFILNSYVTRQVEVLGQGTEMKLEVEDPRQKKVKLGSLTLGQKVTKQVVLVNRSSLDLSFTLTLNANTPLDPKDLSVSPAGELKLKSAGGSCQVEIQFSPRRHVPAFSAELQAEFAGFFHPLLTVQGCCLGVEVLLDLNHLSFGAVVQRCQASRRIVMANIGDIGARFHWMTENFPAELSITPAKGYICPGMEVPFEVTFAPVELSNDRRYEGLSCSLEGSPPPVLLTVTGSCIAASTTQEVVNFLCPVRSSQTQSLSVLNPTNQRCSIRPLIEGEQWRAAPIVTFEPHQNKAVDITYRPLTMTTEGKKHLGSVFLSFPEGRGMLYSLHGTADPPKAEDNILIELPAKALQSQLLTVSNWLSKQQRFHVLMETLKPEKPDATLSLRGLKYMDVPAHANRDYKLSFSAYKEGMYSTKVTFSNEKTGEYLFYLVTFKVTPPGILSSITLETTVRRTVSASIQVENPLTTPTCLSTECKCPDISAPPQHTVPGLSQGVLSFEYHPLHEGESTARLSLLSNDLGYFHHDLILRALPPPPEKTVHFSAPLGCSHAVPVKFTNYSRFKTEYSCKTDNSDFIVDESVGASPGFQLGSEARVEVCFEPHQLGEVKAQLRLYSGIGGEYIFPLHGVCLPPKAQGPLSIRAGRSINIPFKNVFLQTTSFSFQVDNPCFAVKGVESIGSKKNQNISVCFEAPPGACSGPCFGKLTVTSQRSEGSSKATTWVFYLKGHRPESS